MRPWWLRPGVHFGVIGAAIGYLLGHLLGDFVGGGFSRSALSDTERRGDRARLRLRHVIGWLAGLGVFNDLGRMMLGKPLRRESRLQGKEEAGLVEVLQVHARPQGRGHPVPVRHDRLLPDRRPVRHGHQERAAVADLPPHRPRAVPDGGRRARHDDDDDDVLGHPRAVRPVLRPAADRVQAGRVPAARGPRLLAHPGRLRHPAFRHPVRRVPDRLDRLRAAGHPGDAGHGRVLLRVRPDGHLDDPGRLQHDRHRHQLPGARHALEPAPDVRLVDVHGLVPPGAGGAGAGGRVLHGAHGPDLPDRVLHQPARRFQLPVRGPVLVLRPSRGVHPGAAWLRRHFRGGLGVLPQAAIRLQDRRGRDARRGHPQLLRLAAPPVRQRHQPGHAAAVHADHGAHLDPDRVHLPGRHGDVLEGEDPVLHPDAVRAGLLLQLPDRRHQRRVPVGRARGHDRARLLLRDGALPLHDHGRPDLRVHGRHLLLAAEDDRVQAEREAGQGPFLDHVHLLQLDLPAVVRARSDGHAAPRVRVRAQPARRSTTGSRSPRSAWAARYSSS